MEIVLDQMRSLSKDGMKTRFKSTKTTNYEPEGFLVMFCDVLFELWSNLGLKPLFIAGPFRVVSPTGVTQSVDNYPN